MIKASRYNGPSLAYSSDRFNHQPQSGLSGGGSGGTSDPMETRVTKLESDIAEVKTGLQGVVESIAAARAESALNFQSLRTDMAKEFGSVKAEIAELRGKVSSLPTTLQLLGFVIAIFVAAGVLKYFGH